MVNNLRDKDKVAIVTYAGSAGVKLEATLGSDESRLLKDEDFNNDAKDAGDMGAGHTVTAFYEVIPIGVKNDYVGKVDDLKYQEKEKVSVKPTGSNELLP